MIREGERTSDGLQWIVVQSKKSQERRAAREIKGEGMEIYLPMKLTERLRYGKQERLATPFLTSYLFARVQLGLDTWRTIHRMEGVFQVLADRRGDPYLVADWVIRRLRAQEENGLIKMGAPVECGSPQQALVERKTKVLVDRGTCDIEGLFLERVDDNRVAILVSLLQRDSRITVDLRQVKPLATPA